jgi:ketosteroid isomerase-like protein
MKNYFKLTCFILVLQFLCLQAVQANEAATKKVITAKYQAWTKAYYNADVEPIVKELSYDFTAVFLGKRTMHRAEFVANCRTVFDSILKTNSASFQITKLTVEKNRVLVTATQKLDMVLSINNDSQRYKENSVCRDTWVKVGNQWKVKRSEHISGTVTLNGKPVQF